MSFAVNGRFKACTYRAALEEQLRRFLHVFFGDNNFRTVSLGGYSVDRSVVGHFSVRGGSSVLYPVAIFPGDEQHAWGLDVPDIPGCFSAGDDLDDAMAMAKEAIEGHLELLAEDGAAIPIANKLTVHSANPEYAGCTWVVVDIDIMKYLGKAEKLNITLPGHLLNRIDEYVKHHPEQKSRSGFLASAALRVLQEA